MSSEIEPSQAFLKLSADVLSELDIRYMEANLDQQLALRYQLDRAMLTYSRARLAILKNQVQLTPEDVIKMRELREQLSQTSRFNQIFDLALGFIGLLRDRFTTFS
ncbi:hypothetical protein IQ266_02310 [filamentous cyanobacterium LEGE 11480]|uniref:Uncharacterized protein n=1 Tax=Romeriopsis navalis LEGE 11480 TaxID=2777977 RepID=A0A928VM89_9CYAN|nr:hypothetical protein [Romeriopsis navalis]MBE9028589.1 hypothetical protein [Romeriopsis navalis LEGE 11480]